MRSEKAQSKNPSGYAAEEDRLRVAEMSQYLLSLAKLYGEDRTGNTELSEGLRRVAQVLRPYADCLVLELPNAIKGKAPSSDRRKTALARAKSQLPHALESIGHEATEGILDNESYTKQQLAELGVRRFGISRSKLERLRKKDARGSIRAALEHEKSLDMISMEARRGGKAR